MIYAIEDHSHQRCGFKYTTQKLKKYCCNIFTWCYSDLVERKMARKASVNDIAEHTYLDVRDLKSKDMPVLFSDCILSVMQKKFRIILL